MKKLFAIATLMALAMNGFAQILNYDFSAVCETGQTLYYRISSEEEHTVKITYPYSEANSFFQGNFYEGFPEPQGEIILPATVTYNDVDYAVTAIDNNAFFNCHLTGTLTISDGIVSIGSMGFIGCRFTSIIIPRSIGRQFCFLWSWRWRQSDYPQFCNFYQRPSFLWMFLFRHTQPFGFVTIYWRCCFWIEPVFRFSDTSKFLVWDRRRGVC